MVGLDDVALAQGARNVAVTDPSRAWLLVPGVAAMPLRRIKRNWITATERGRVSVQIESAPDGFDARFVLPDLLVDVRDASGPTTERPAWLWPEEWFPDVHEAKPEGSAELTLSASISSCVHLVISASVPSGGSGCPALRRPWPGQAMSETFARSYGG